MCEEENKKEENKGDSSAFVDLDFVGEFLDIASGVVSKVKDNIPSSSQGEEIVNNITETISSVTGTVGEHAGDILDGASKVAEGLIDIVGDIAGNIDS